MKKSGVRIALAMIIPIPHLSGWQAHLSHPYRCSFTAPPRAPNRITRLLLLALLAIAALVPTSVHGAPTGTIVVTNLNDSGSGSLRDAIIQANAGVADDTITFSISGTITLASPLPDIADASTAGKLTIDGGGAITINGNYSVRVFYVDPGGDLTLQNLTLTKGVATDGGGLFNDTGTVTIANSTIYDNHADFSGGGLYNDGGTVIITNSTFSNNSGGGNGSGGGLFNDAGTVIATNSTFYDNSAGVSGGGLYTRHGTVTITNSTVSNNSVGVDGGGLFNYAGTVTITNSTFYGNNAAGDGDELYNGGATTLTNTIVANNSPNGGNCFGSTITNGGHNIDDGTTCGWGNNNGSMSNTDPQLGTLTGSPAYHPLNSSSPAIDAGTNTGCPADSQNGVARPQDSDGNGSAICEIGSYEAPAAVCAEDVSGDGVINIVDIQMVAAGWNGADPNLDVDDDGDVDIDDIQQVAGRWRDSC